MSPVTRVQRIPGITITDPSWPTVDLFDPFEGLIHEWDPDSLSGGGSEVATFPATRGGVTLSKEGETLGPTLREGVWNGHNVLEFDGTQRLSHVDPSFSPLSGMEQGGVVTFVVVAELLPTSGSQAVVVAGGPINDPRRSIERTLTSLRIRKGSAQGFFGIGDPTAAGRIVAINSYAETMRWIASGGTVGAGAQGGIPSQASLYLGQRPDFPENAGLVGSIAYFGIFAGEWSSTEMRRRLAFFESKYGITG